MDIVKAEFVTSNTGVNKCPKPDRHEYAFIGRSNVGKSSLINMLVNNKNLAKTAAKPGKTQLINHFLINDEWYMVDLPGYGFARTSKAAQIQFEKMIRDYIRASGYKMQYVARALKISPNALNLKLQGRTQFKLSEAERLSAVLGLSMYERDLCFFEEQNRREVLARRADEKRRAEHDKRAEKSDAAGTVPVWDAAACTKPGGAQLVRRH